jgi:tetratricopeptide (TPR) repeat protein
MNTNKIHSYLIAAKEAYPYDLEEAYEKISYALSYEPNCSHSLVLMGRFHSEQFSDFETACDYFEQAMESNIENRNIYEPFIYALTQVERYEQATKLIRYATSIKGTDKGNLYWSECMLLEKQKQYKKALKCLKIAEGYGYNDSFLTFLKEEKNRISNKITPNKNRGKKKKKKKVKKK